MNFVPYLLFLEDSSSEETVEKVTKTPFEITCYVLGGIAFVLLLGLVVIAILDTLFRFLYVKKMNGVNEIMHSLTYEMDKKEAEAVTFRTGLKPYRQTKYRTIYHIRYSVIRCDELILVFSNENKLIEYTFKKGK